ncbi:cytoplasm protein [Mucor ambiguus]|uniref:Cytoplasm protein n=1 Tax=Mucor ambiguus TaxID=91626 RepID=A0A0C9M697_9FUNG|nr:cytoplasm protein [Mucor ambiguus]
MFPVEQPFQIMNDSDGQGYYSDMYGQLMQQQQLQQQQSLHPQPHHHHHHHLHHHPNAAEIRTVYLGNIPNDVSVSDIIDHVKTGAIQAIRPLPEKNGIFITFIDSYAASQFYHEAQRIRLTIRGHELKIGWGKSSVLNPHMQLALQNGASRNVYLGLLDESVAEQDLKDDLSRFGHIEHIKIIPERRIAFVHYLCVSNAVKCINAIPTETKWQSKRVNFGKDRCAARAPHPAIYQHLLPQPLFHAAQPHPSPPSSSVSVSAPPPPPTTAILSSQFDLMNGLPVIYNHPIDHNIGSVANRTIYLGNIHSDTTAEDICNVIRGGILSQIRFMPDKHIAFVTFVDPQVASIFINQALHHCIVIKNRRIKVGWGKPAALPINVIQAVQNGGSRNVYVGNIDGTVTEEKLKHDFSEYGNIELVNTLKEKNCAFVNFTSIAEAVRAIEGIRSKEEYKKFRINYGKDRCGKALRFQHAYSTKYSSNATEQDDSQVEIKHGNTTMSNTTGSDLTL